MGNLFVSPSADRIAKGHDLGGKVAIVTGASSGIGLEVTRTLAKRGAMVLLTCRESQQGEKARRTILEQIGHRFAEKILVMELDLSSFLSIENFAQAFRDMKLPLHYLILNAAVLGGLYRLTNEGFEYHFGVNYLGHFYLTQLLKSTLLKNPDEDVRIVAVCCSSRRRIKLRPNSLGKSQAQNHNAFKAYDQSKLLLRYFAEELSVQLEDTNVSVVGADPGATNTWLIKNLNPILLTVIAFASMFMKTPSQGAATVVFACLERKIRKKSKPFCSNCRVLKLNLGRCRDPRLRKALYTKTQELTKEATVDGCALETFNPKIEVWRSVTKMIAKFAKTRTFLSKDNPIVRKFSAGTLSIMTSSMFYSLILLDYLLSRLSIDSVVTFSLLDIHWIKLTTRFLG